MGNEKLDYPGVYYASENVLLDTKKMREFFDTLSEQKREQLSETEMFFQLERELSEKEAKFLKILISRKDRYYPRSSLIKEMWGEDYSSSKAGYLSLIVKKINSKYLELIDNEQLILTKWSKGYYFNPSIKSLIKK